MISIDVSYAYANYATYDGTFLRYLFIEAINRNFCSDWRVSDWSNYGQRDAANALKRFLIGQLVKFFLLIDASNASKHL